MIRPTTEVIGKFTKTNEIGILGTKGTVKSSSYLIEIEKFFPEIKVHQQACPMWVSLVENAAHKTIGADYFIQKDLNKLLSKSSKIDALLLGCTHYPLLMDSIETMVPKRIRVIQQGEIVAKSLENYLHRHPEIAQHCAKGQQLVFQTTGDVEAFKKRGALFFGAQLETVEKVIIA